MPRRLVGGCTAAAAAVLTVLLAVPAVATPAQRVDTTPPTATIVIDDTSIAIGETLQVTITFSEAVTGFDIGDLTVPNATVGPLSTSDNITWTTTLTPVASPSAGNVITLAMSGVSDVAGNHGGPDALSNAYSTDPDRPTSFVVVADNDLRTGETSLVTITFSEAVTGFDNADLNVPNGTLGTVTTPDDITWTAFFTPNASITDATNIITLANNGLTDAAGNPGSGSTASNNYAISTVRPTATVVVADATITSGEVSLVIITFSEAVSGFTNADLTVPNGTLSALTSFDGGITWTAIFSPAASITDATNLITLNNAGVTNAATNAGTGSTDSNNYAVDTHRPPPASSSPTPTSASARPPW